MRSSAIYPELAAKYDVVFYPFFLDGVALDDSLMQDDGIHPNAKGVAKIVESIMPKVDELLAQVKSKELSVDERNSSTEVVCCRLNPDREDRASERCKIGEVRNESVCVGTCHGLESSGRSRG